MNNINPQDLLTKPSVIIAATLLLSACAHHPDVRPGEDNLHTVIVIEETGELGGKEAIRQAKSFCKQDKLKPAIINETTTFTGDMDEGHYKDAKTAAAAASIIGSMAWLLGSDNKQKDAGKVLVAGGAIGDAALGEDYAVEMQFKCQ